MDMLRKLWDILTRAERVRMCVLLAGIVVGSVWEALALGMLVPFITLINNPATAQRETWKWIAAWTGSLDTSQVLLPAAASLFVLFLLKNIYLTVLTRFQFSFIYRTQGVLSCRLLRAYLSAPWPFHLQRNTAELLRDVNVEVPLVFSNVLNPLIVLVTESLVTLAVVVLLLLVDPVSSFLSIGLLGSASLGFYRLVRRKTDRFGDEQQRTRVEMIKCVNEGLGAIKETKVLGREEYFAAAFGRESRQCARATAYIATVGQLPRFFLEVVIVGGMLVVLSVMTWRHRDSASAFTALALCGVAAFRLMPAMNRVVACVANIRYHRGAVSVVHAGLERFGHMAVDSTPSSPPPVRLPLQHQLELRDIAYRYPGACADSIQSISFSIPMGFSVGITGPSGAGKTTLVDIIVGLLAPSRGQILIDGRDIYQDLAAWRSRLGYIPQNVYLLDDSVKRNVALGIPDAEVNEEQVWAALRAAQLEKLVRQLPAGLDAGVGERGVRFSGGERQRLGIARALYHNPDVLVLDEATASLDVETEREVTAAFQGLRGTKTLIIIAHHLATIEQCDVIYELTDGRIADMRWSESRAGA